jgi:hypothetical protein
MLSHSSTLKTSFFIELSFLSFQLNYTAHTLRVLEQLTAEPRSEGAISSARGAPVLLPSALRLSLSTCHGILDAKPS